MAGTLWPQTVSTKRQRIAEIATRFQGEALTSLSHHIDTEWMQAAFHRTRRDGASGIDGVTCSDYEANLEANLRSLLARAKAGDPYRAPPVRRVYIPKGNGELRALGLPTFEDKVLQRAVLMAIEPVYEQDFLPCSFGFRPGRSQHQCLDALRDGLMEMHGGVVLELDIRKCFDSFDHEILQSLLRDRIRDGVVLRLIGKWLNAGVMEDQRLWYPEAGSPQGGVISPLLANVFLHHVLDVWFHEQVQPVMRGRSFMVRYADDAVLCFEHDHDAQRVMQVIGKRFARFGLEVHPVKTRLVNFRRPPRNRKPPSDGPKLGTIEFLGFRLYWGRTKRGNWAIIHKTSASRMRRSISKLREWLRTAIHMPLADQHAALCRKIRGHDAYFGWRGNRRSLLKVRRAVERAWMQSLRRRSQKRHMTWERFARVLKHYPLPKHRMIPYKFA